MTRSQPTILITGFLGAGKTTLAHHLRDILMQPVSEVHGLATAGAVFPDTDDVACVIAVIDAANLTAQLDDPLYARLLLAQIAEADLLVLTRTDVVEAGPALDRLRPLQAAPLVEAEFGRIPADTIPGRGAAGLSTLDLSGDFTQWAYDGPAVLTQADAEALLADRPKGIFRLSGVANTGDHGVELQLTGRVRQSTRVPGEQATRLSAWGPKGRFDRRALDALFSEKVAASISMSSFFSYR